MDGNTGIIDRILDSIFGCEKERLIIFIYLFNHAPPPTHTNTQTWKKTPISSHHLVILLFAKEEVRSCLKWEDVGPCPNWKESLCPVQIERRLAFVRFEKGLGMSRMRRQGGSWPEWEDVGSCFVLRVGWVLSGLRGYCLLSELGGGRVLSELKEELVSCPDWEEAGFCPIWEGVGSCPEWEEMVGPGRSERILGPVRTESRLGPVRTARRLRPVRIERRLRPVLTESKGLIFLWTESRGWVLYKLREDYILSKLRGGRFCWK